MGFLRQMKAGFRCPECLFSTASENMIALMQKLKHSHPLSCYCKEKYNELLGVGQNFLKFEHMEASGLLLTVRVLGCVPKLLKLTE